MKISGRMLGNRLCREYAFYSKVKRFGKMHSNRVVRRRLNREV